MDMHKKQNNQRCTFGADATILPCLGVLASAALQVVFHKVANAPVTLAWGMARKSQGQTPWLACAVQPPGPCYRVPKNLPVPAAHGAT